MTTPARSEIMTVLDQVKTVVQVFSRPNHYVLWQTVRRGNVQFEAFLCGGDAESVHGVRVCLLHKRWWGLWWDREVVFSYDLNTIDVADDAEDDESFPGLFYDYVKDTSVFRRGSWQKTLEEAYFAAIQRRETRRKAGFLPVDGEYE